MATRKADTSTTQWHRLLGTLLEYVLTPVGIDVSTSVEIMGRPPEADILLLRRHGAHWTEQQKARLPDGIRDSDAGHILIEFKYTESLNEDALRQAVGYDYFYQTSQQLKRRELQTALISAKTPRSTTLSKFGYDRVGPPGVYGSRYALVNRILLLVANELDDSPHNAAVKCFASRVVIKRQALEQLQHHTGNRAPLKLLWFLDGLWSWFFGQGGFTMAQEPTITPEYITNLGKRVVEQMLSSLPPEELLRGVPLEERLRGVPHEEVLKQFSPDERLKDLDIAEIERILQEKKRQTGKATTPSSSKK